ncbi:MAG: 1-acyl-sn-glycerol-3-phosphate acyltransferase [Clostridia bacterium]|nr:1-acyl-sn-glycerol-3-phosphate acyltransferase [Clostridia bacterium]
MSENDIVLAPDRVEVVEKIKKYEAEGGESFFLDVENDPPSRTIMPDEVDYLNKKLSSKIKCFFARIIEWFAQRVVKKKFDITVEGAENIRDITGGAIITSNHFSIFENLAVKIASEKTKKKHKFWKVIREGNYFMPGIIGFLLKNCRTLPISSNLHTMQKLDKAISTIVKKGDFVLVYPEQAMWWNYPKPREYRIGAFHYASKNNVPVIPCFVTFSKMGTRGENGYPDLKYTIHIMKPIYPDPTKTVRENARLMHDYNKRVCHEKYEEIYGIPVSYGDYEVDLTI